MEPTKERAFADVARDEIAAIDPRSTRRLWPSTRRIEDGQRDYPVEDGIAEIHVCGPLQRRGGWFMGYDDVERRIMTADADPQVAAIVLRIDSPGGVCAGAFETVRSVRATKTKPIVAYVDESAFSAGYAIACIADEIILPASGEVGSIGVISMRVDESKALEKAGVRVELITSGDRKADGHFAQPISDEEIADEQRKIDRLGQMFFGLVADARGVSSADVEALQAATFMGADAIAVGLANGVGTLDVAIARARARVKSPARPQPLWQKFGASTRPQEKQMNTVLEALGLKNDSNEADVLAAVTALNTVARELTRIAGAKNAAEALGVLQGWKASAEKLAAVEEELRAQKAAAEAKEREALIVQAERDGKLTPAQRGWARSQSLEGLKGFLAAAPRIAAIADGPTLEPPHDSDAPTNPKLAELAKKSWAQLTPIEKAQLYNEDRASYDAKKAAAGR